MQIILFRHGPAGRHNAERWPDDGLRPLTVRGRERTRLAARGLKAMLVREPMILTSPLKRAKQTADILSEQLDDIPVQIQRELEPGTPQRRLIQQLVSRKSDECVVLVGHEPDLGALAGVLLTGATMAFPLKKAGACSIHFVGPVEPGTGRLDWLMTPHALRLLARAGKKVAR